MPREVIERYAPGGDDAHIEALRRGGMEVIFGDPEDRPCELLGPEAFPTPKDIRPDAELRRGCGVADEDTGANSRTVYWRFFSSCAGWRSPPTPQELYAAIRDEAPNARRRSVLHTWFQEASNSEILWGWIEEAYTWPLLVAAIHRLGYRRNSLNHYINGFAMSQKPSSFARASHPAPNPAL